MAQVVSGERVCDSDGSWSWDLVAFTCQPAFVWDLPASSRHPSTRPQKPFSYAHLQYVIGYNSGRKGDHKAITISLYGASIENEIYYPTCDRKAKHGVQQEMENTYT